MWSATRRILCWYFSNTFFLSSVATFSLPFFLPAPILFPPCISIKLVYKSRYQVSLQGFRYENQQLLCQFHHFFPLFPKCLAMAKMPQNLAAQLCKFVLILLHGLH